MSEVDDSREPLSGAPLPEAAPNDAPDERVGTLVGDKWEIVRRLGSGGMGRVYEARHRVLGRAVAIKFLRPELALDSEMSRRFTNEALALGPIAHPNLVAVTDVGHTSDGASYLVMDLLAGQDGAALLAQSGPLPVERAANIVLQACRGLGAAHKAGIVHRDIKPENLFVTDAGDGTDLVKVLDFGIAKRLATSASAATRRGMVMGTAFYMSPEQAVSTADVDHRTDVWSLAVVLYEFLSARKPFEGGDWSEVLRKIVCETPLPLARLRPEVPGELGSVVERALAKRVGDRYASMEAFADALTPFADRWSRAPAPPSAPPVSRVTPVSAASPPVSLATPTRPSPETGSVVVPGSASAPLGRRFALGLLVALALGAALAGAGLRWARGLHAMEAESAASAERAAPELRPLAPLAGSAPPGASSVRSLFEHTERVSNSSPAGGTASASTLRAVASPAKRERKPAPSPATDATPDVSRRRITIDTVSPY